MNPDTLLSGPQAAAYLGVSRQAVYLLTKQGHGARYGHVWMFTREELDRWKATPRRGGGRPKKHTVTPATEQNKEL
jgi:excisionase family DNA binding protein